MMGAASALQSAMVAQMSQVGEFTGVYHDAPARAQFPYAVLACSDEKDWSCKGREGREIAIQLVLWDDEPARLLDLEELVVLSPELLEIDASWHLSTLQLTGRRRVRNPSGPWNTVFDVRARMLATPDGGQQ